MGQDMQRSARGTPDFAERVGFALLVQENPDEAIELFAEHTLRIATATSERIVNRYDVINRLRHLGIDHEDIAQEATLQITQSFKKCPDKWANMTTLHVYNTICRTVENKLIDKLRIKRDRKRSDNVRLDQCGTTVNDAELRLIVFEWIASRTQLERDLLRLLAEAKRGTSDLRACRSSVRNFVIPTFARRHGMKPTEARQMIDRLMVEFCEWVR